MGKLKNALQTSLETDSQFADDYWQNQDRVYPEPELPEEHHLSARNLSEKPANTLANHQFNADLPF